MFLIIKWAKELKWSRDIQKERKSEEERLDDAYYKHNLCFSEQQRNIFPILCELFFNIFYPLLHYQAVIP